MSRVRRSVRWRFSLWTLGFIVLVVCVFCAMNLAGQGPRVVAESGDGHAIYATVYGWPAGYLRVPTGNYASAPADFFMPGLLVNLAALLLGVGGVWWLSRMSFWRRSQRASG